MLKHVTVFKSSKAELIYHIHLKTIIFFLISKIYNTFSTINNHMDIIMSYFFTRLLEINHKISQ